MYTLTVLGLDLKPLHTTGNPVCGSLPFLVGFLQTVLNAFQSYGTILNSINDCGSYARSSVDVFGTRCIVTVVRLPK